ncbi:MAG: AMP-binding protein, partial [Ilumatobacteraceae bacterium]|nr:AMP-binding protein [Ilumatobacteraceae bacterium]
MTINIGNLLARRAHVNAKMEALYDVAADRRFTYAELNAETNRAAQLLVRAGVKKGDRVGLLLMNSAEYLTSFFATAKLGAVIVPLNWRLVADELEFILKDSGTTALVFGAEFAATVSDLQSRGAKTDVRSWLYVGDSANKPEYALDYVTESAKEQPIEPAVTASGDDLLYIMYTSGTTGLPKGVMHSHNTQYW